MLLVAALATFARSASALDERLQQKSCQALVYVRLLPLAEKYLTQFHIPVESFADCTAVIEQAMKRYAEERPYLEPRSLRARYVLFEPGTSYFRNWIAKGELMHQPESGKGKGQK